MSSRGNEPGSHDPDVAGYLKGLAGMSADRCPKVQACKFLTPNVWFSPPKSPPPLPRHSLAALHGQRRHCREFRRPADDAGKAGRQAFPVAECGGGAAASELRRP